MPTPLHPIPLRPLGLWEASCALNSRRTYGAGTMLIMAEGVGPLSKEAVHNAAKALFERHQILRCRLTEDDPIPEFVDDVRFSDLPLTMQSADSDREVVEIWEQMLHEQLPDMRRLWELRLVPTTDAKTWRLFLKTHHAIADGRSLASAMDQLLELAAAHIRSETLATSYIPLPAHSESRVAHPVDRDDFAASTAQSDKPEPITSWLLDCEADLASRRPRVAFRCLDVEASGRLRIRCHDEGVTVLEAVVGALSVVQARHATHAGGVIDTDFIVPIDMRRFFEPPSGHHEIQMGAYCVRVFLPEVTATDDPWNLARRFHDAFVPLLTESQLPPWNATAQDVLDGHDLWKDINGQYIHGFCPTNLGVLPSDMDHAPLVTNRVELTAAAQAGGFPVLMPLLSHKGVLRANFTWTEPLMADHTAHGWIDDIWEKVTSMAG